MGGKSAFKSAKDKEALLVVVCEEDGMITACGVCLNSEIVDVKDQQRQKMQKIKEVYVKVL